MTGASAVRRLKHWGWGYEDQQPPPGEVEAAAVGVRATLGFEPQAAERAVPLSAVHLPAPRVEPPASLAAICASDDYARASRAYGKAYRDVVRAFRGRFDHPPDVVATPRSEDEVADVLEWCSSAR